MQYQLSRVVAGPLLRLLWRPRITGLEYIPPEGGARSKENSNPSATERGARLKENGGASWG